MTWETIFWSLVRENIYNHFYYPVIPLLPVEPRLPFWSGAEGGEKEEVVIFHLAFFNLKYVGHMVLLCVNSLPCLKISYFTYLG